MRGTIEEVSIDGECRQFCAMIGPHGFLEDHSGTEGIVVLNAAVPHHINQEYGEKIQVMAGQLGDNILVNGLGDLVDLAPGTFLQIKKEVLLRVVSKATHYRTMFPHFPAEVLALLDTRGGVTCEVVVGVGARICDGDEIDILPAEELKGAA